jgi:glutaredoxin
MNITIYSTTTCATCHLVTGWLDKQGVAYTKKNTDEDPAAMTEFMEVNEGHIGVPFTVIENDGQTTKIANFDQGKFKTALGL